MQKASQYLIHNSLSFTHMSSPACKKELLMNGMTSGAERSASSSDGKPIYFSLIYIDRLDQNVR